MSAATLTYGTPALDVRNVFWLLAAMAFVVAPHLERTPAWATVFCASMLAWRAWIAWAALRFPSHWIIKLFTIGATVGTLYSYKTFVIGRDAGVTLLIVMASMKLLEMRTQREVVLSIYLGFFLVLTNFLYSQSIPLGIYLLFSVWFFVATLVGFHRVGRTPTVRERLVPAGLLLLQALPLMAVFFMLFPRIQGPLWALPQDARAGITGLSDSMTPGNISQLIQSEALAFRVQFEDRIPPYQTLYWRGPVMWLFDGRTWKTSDFARAAALEYSKAEKPVRYAVTLEPHGKHWLFALDVPASAPQGSSSRDDLQLRSIRPVDQTVRYELVSYLDYQYGEKLPGILRRFALSFDETRNPRTIALGRQWRDELGGDAAAIVNRAFQFYNREFTYTLEPPMLGERDPYDEFLFETKRGFCEHYAGSFALLMRAAGIPARVVTGYQGGDINPLNNELIVRQADAHAWTEVWIENRGWVRSDPTAAVSPLRVEGGVNAALGPIGAMSSLIAADKLGILSRMRYAWQFANSQWEQWVVGYNVDRQRQFLAQLGLGLNIDWRTMALWLVGLTFLVGGAISLGLLVRDRPRRGEPAVVAWKRFCAKLAATGLVRAPHEGPLDYLSRITQARPELEHDASEITRRYIDARYGSGITADEIRELRRRVRAFKAA